MLLIFVSFVNEKIVDHEGQVCRSPLHGTSNNKTQRHFEIKEKLLTAFWTKKQSKINYTFF